MAGNEASFIVRLIDKITRPARQAAKAMGGLQQQIGHVEKATKPATRGMQGLGLAGSIMGNTLGGIAANAVTSLATGMLGLGKSAATAVLQATDFTQRMGMGFASVAKHGASAEKLFAHVRKLSEDLGLGVQDTSQQFLRFLSLGFDPKMGTDLIKMGADLRVFGATGEDVSRIFSQLGQIASKGKLQGEELIVLAENGISTKFVYEALAKQLGKTTEEVMKMQQAGKLTADAALPAILEAVKRQTGAANLGDAGKRVADTTLAGMQGRLGARMENLLLDVGKRVEGPIVRALSPIGNSIMETLGSPAVVDGLVVAIGMISRAIEAVWPAIKSFGSGILNGLGGAMGGVAGSFESFIKQLSSPEFAAAMQSWGQRLGVTIGAALRLAGAVLEIIPALMRLGDAAQKPFDLIRNAAAWLIEQAATWGPAIVRGLVDGIIKGLSLIRDAAKQLTGTFSKAVTGELQIHSPSKLMEQLGVMTTAGEPLAFRSYRQRSCPVFASTPARPLARNCTYCFTPDNSA